MAWSGDVPAAAAVTINYQARVAAGVPPGAPLCITTEFDPGTGITTSITECTTVDCPPTAVELLSFKAIGLRERALLVWETAGEQGTLGYNVQRAAGADGPWQAINRALVPATGGPAAGTTYTLRDAAGAGTWHYRLEDVSQDGKRSLHPAVEVRIGPDAAGRELYLPRSHGAQRAGASSPLVAPVPVRDLGFLNRMQRWLGLGT